MRSHVRHLDPFCCGRPDIQLDRPERRRSRRMSLERGFRLDASTPADRSGGRAAAVKDGDVAAAAVDDVVVS